MDSLLKGMTLGGLVATLKILMQQLIYYVNNMYIIEP